MDSHQHLFSLSHFLSYWPNQSGNIWHGTHILLLWAFWILYAIALLYIRFKGNLSDNLNAATLLSCNSDQDALTISFVYQMYPLAVICLFHTRDFFSVARRFSLPCHISKKLCNLAILCNFHSSASFFSSKLFSVFVVSNGWSSSSKIPWLAWAKCRTMAFSRRVLPVILDCL